MQNRANIFSPFDALEGFKNRIKQEEIILEEKPILSEDQIDSLNEVLISLKVGNNIEVTYFKNKRIKVKGIVTKINMIKKIIRINNIDIDIISIINIERENSYNI